MATNTKLLTPNKYLGEGWHSINTWQSYLENFSLHIPDDNTITRNYKEARQIYYNLAHSGVYKELLQEIMAEDAEGGIGGITLEETIEQVLNFIQSQGNLWSYVQSRKGRMRVSTSQAQQISNNWQKILSLARQEQWTSVSVELTRIESMVQSLNVAIASSSNGMVNIGKALGMGGNKRSSSIANSIQGTLNSLRGKLLEEKAVEFLDKHLPEQFKDEVGVYQTGAILVGGKSIKEDIMVIFDGLEIVNNNNEVIYKFSNGKIIPTDKAPKKDSVILTEEQYQKLQDVALGMSAKTSRNSTVYHGGLNIKDFLDSVSGKDPIIFQLIHMYQLGDGKNHTLYQKYAISKKLDYILGNKNAFMISRSKIVPTYKFVEQLTIKPLRFGTSVLPKRGENAPLNTEFGSTNITGISSSSV